MKKILVTGGAGYIGSVLLPYLLQEDFDVTVYDVLHYSGCGLIPHINKENFHFIKGDVRDKENLRKAVSQNDVVIHLAAIVGLPACKRDPNLAESTNVQGTQNVLDSLSPDQRVIYASSVSNYGAASGHSCDEQSPLYPISCYGVTKTEAEKMMLDSENSLCFRFATAFGVSPRMRLDLLINDFVHQACVNRILTLFEKSYKRTFAHVRDISRCLLYALNNFDRLTHKLYNVGDNANNVSKEDIALKIKERVDYYLHFAEIEKDEDQRNYSVSYDLINSIGFRTEISIDEGIDELVKACPLFESAPPYRNF